MGCYTIHPTRGLSSADYRRAVRLGPTHVASQYEPDELLRRAGFNDIVLTDVTDTFRVTCNALLDARNRHADALSAFQGKPDFADEQARKRGHLRGIEAGLLQRSLVMGTR